MYASPVRTHAALPGLPGHAPHKFRSQIVRSLLFRELVNSQFGGFKPSLYATVVRIRDMPQWMNHANDTGLDESSAQVREAIMFRCSTTELCAHEVGAAGFEPATIRLYASPVRAHTTLPIKQSSTWRTPAQEQFCVTRKAGRASSRSSEFRILAS